MTSTMVISDTHFGLESSTLSKEKQVDNLIWEIWKFGGGCDEVVLLGDIFDLWRARAEKAVLEAGYLFERLAGLGVAVKYVVGNHDHHLTMINHENQFLEGVASGEMHCEYHPNLAWNQVINGLEVDMYYPSYSVRRFDRNILFTHGHHLDGVHAFSLQVVEKLRGLSGGEITPGDLEMMMAYAYESIYRSGYIGEMVELEERLWKVSSMFGRVKTGILKTFRFTPVDRQYEAIVKFIADRSEEEVDCFVYGDTHEAGMYSRVGGPLAVNAGSFVHDGDGGFGSEKSMLPDTYLILDSSGATIRRLGIQKEIAREDLS